MFPGKTKLSVVVQFHFLPPTMFSDYNTVHKHVKKYREPVIMFKQKKSYIDNVQHREPAANMKIKEIVSQSVVYCSQC